MRNCLSYWFPLVQKTGVRVPETRIVMAPDDIGNWPYQGEPDAPPMSDLRQFEADLRTAIAEIGGTPCFLRSGQTSNKHNWRNSCYLGEASRLMRHVFNIVEFSSICDMIGLPANVWAVRKLIPTSTLFHAFHGEFPVTREFRVFVQDSKLQCVHPYWPVDAVGKGRPSDPDWQGKLEDASIIAAGVKDGILGIAMAASEFLPGAWSVDVLQDSSGDWWVTDCADAGCSFHSSGCPNEKRWERNA